MWEATSSQSVLPVTVHIFPFSNKLSNKHIFSYAAPIYILLCLPALVV